MKDQAAKTKAALGMVLAVSEAIRELKQVPSGHLYANLITHIDLSTYTQIIDVLKRSGLVAEDGFHMLTWIGGTNA